MNSVAHPRQSLLHSLPASLAYPARPHVLAMLALCALARLVSYQLGSAITIQWLPTFAIAGSPRGAFPLLLGLVVDLIFAMLVFKVAVEALLNSARDRLGPGKAGAMAATDSHAIGQIAVLIVFLAPAYLLALRDGPGLVWMALAGAWLLLPAAILLQAIDENIWHALDPRAWLALVARLGAGYFGLLALLGGLALLVVGLQALLASLLPGALAAVGSRFASLYALVVAYQLMGQLTYQRHAALGFDIAPPIVRPRLDNVEEDDTLRAAEALVADDKPTQAADCLHDLIRRRGASAPIHERYRSLLLATRDLARLSEHGREYTSILLALRQDKRALAMVNQSRAHDPAFQLEDADDITRLIAHAAATGHSQLAVELAAGFDHRFPKSHDIAQNILTAARLMAERLGREAEARQLLEAVALRYPDHALAADIRGALAAVKRMLAVEGADR